jgi:ketosteroid isomerase-like protein
MSDLDSLQLVQQTYAAFGQGDLPGVLNNMAEDITWESGYTTQVPFAGQWRGHEQILKFFATLNNTLDVQDFRIDDMISQGDTVIALGHEAARIKATGSEYRNEWVHVWKVKQGKVAEIKTYNDTATVAAAFQSS